MGYAQRCDEHKHPRFQHFTLQLRLLGMIWHQKILHTYFLLVNILKTLEGKMGPSQSVGKKVRMHEGSISSWSLCFLFCSAVKWASHYLVPRYSSSWSVGRYHYAVICSEDHTSKHWQLNGSHTSLWQRWWLYDHYSVPLARLLVNLHLHLVLGKRPRSDNLHLQMPSGWWGWNAVLGGAHNGPKSDCGAETTSHPLGCGWKAAALFYEFTYLQAADKVYTLIFF